MPPCWAVFFFSSIEGKTLYTREYYTHEYINEMTRFKAEEELVFMTAEELEKTGLINEFI